MKYVFFGTPEFSGIILRKLISADVSPLAVVCNRDRPVGRKKIVTPPPVKTLAIEHRTQNIKILQPEKLDEGFRSQISDLKTDFAIVASYAKIIPKSVIELFPRGIIGVHPSLLPKYRGSSPIQTAILNGETVTGVTLYMLDEKMDHGPVLVKQELGLVISGLQFPKLLQKLAELGGDMLVETLPKFLHCDIKPHTQNETDATYTKKFKTEDAFISTEDFAAAISGNSSEISIEIERKIRALNPEPGVWTTQNGKRLKLLEAEMKDGRLVLKKTQLEGEKPKSV
ncbi:MAG: methionyl-tRNA formyltransferase [Patescibacteria group bacterium]|nr:methionyl-tRNA formyltransferase [Patescibacteria group bacterium]MDE2015710.1 methionyl-tRNA formyltransferase [Patescibacteria group bacterium]MDE2226768.1 methionyl-tRNA formyltransferase [Patescibacteria group bacterium]